MILPSDITVITPTIPGREAFLQECKDSVASQTTPPAAHLVYLDGNRDGIQYSMNQLWPQVKTKYIQFLADDDRLLPHHIETVAALCDPADIVHPAGELIDGHGNTMGSAHAYHNPISATNKFIHATATLRTEMVRDLGGWHPTDYPEDHHFWVKAYDAGYKFLHSKEVTWQYRRHVGNNSSGGAPGGNLAARRDHRNTHEWKQREGDDG